MNSGGHANARIMDHFSDSGEVQIWYDNPASDWRNYRWQGFEFSVPDTLKIIDYLKSSTLTSGPYKIIDYIPDGKDDEFEAMKIELLQKVSVLYRDDNFYDGFIDGFDPISRRHHIVYNNGSSQWIWLNEKNVKMIERDLSDKAEEMLKAIKSSQEFATPPPWDPAPYGMDGSWEERSREIEKQLEEKKKPRGTGDNSSSVKENNDDDEEEMKSDAGSSKPTKRKKTTTAVMAVATSDSDSNSKTNSSKVCDFPIFLFVSIGH